MIQRTEEISNELKIPVLFDGFTSLRHQIELIVNIVNCKKMRASYKLASTLKSTNLSLYKRDDKLTILSHPIQSGRQHGQLHSKSIGPKSVAYILFRKLRTPRGVIAEQVEHLGRARGVQRTGRLVGQAAGSAGWPARGRSPRAGAGRPTAAAGSSPARSSMPSRSSSSRARASAACCRAPPTSAASATFSSAVRCSIRWKNWNTIPTWRRRSRASAVAPSPSRRTPAISMLPSSARFEPGEHVQQRGLPAARRPHQGDELAVRDHEVDAAQRADRSGLRVERPAQPSGDELGAGNRIVRPHLTDLPMHSPYAE